MVVHQDSEFGFEIRLLFDNRLIILRHYFLQIPSRCRFARFTDRMNQTFQSSLVRRSQSALTIFLLVRYRSF